jgi:hypothetical protein
MNIKYCMNLENRFYFGTRKYMVHVALQWNVEEAAAALFYIWCCPSSHGRQAPGNLGLFVRVDGIRANAVSCVGFYFPVCTAIRAYCTFVQTGWTRTPFHGCSRRRRRRLPRRCGTCSVLATTAHHDPRSRVFSGGPLRSAPAGGAPCSTARGMPRLESSLVRPCARACMPYIVVAIPSSGFLRALFFDLSGTVACGP